MSTINDRISLIITHFGYNKNSFSKKIGIENNVTIGNIVNGRLNKPSFDIIEKILQNFDSISSEWLLTGKGEMLKEPETKHIAKKDSNGIPLIPVDAMAGIFNGDMQILEHECDKYVVPIFKGADFLIPVKGSSMYPKYNSGDIVACKKLTIDTFFQWNKVYVLDTDQGALIKRIHKGKSESTILIVSDNEKYVPFELERSHIHNIAIVMGVIRLE